MERVERKGERGIALVMALLVLLVVSIVGALLMASLQSETKLTSHATRETSALNVAEAGIGEAMAHIANGDMPSDMGNPHQVAVVFNTATGSVPVLGTDTLTFATSQPAGQWLPYSSSTRSSNMLTIEYKTNNARTACYRYNTAMSDPLQTAGAGFPVFRITSTGIVGNDRRRIVTEIIQRPVNTNIKAALAANCDIQFVGNAVVCGYSHSADTTPPTGDNGRFGAGPCFPFETFPDSLPASWSSGNTSGGGASGQTGALPINQSNQTGFYQGPWEAIGLQQSEFWSWVGAPLTSEPPSPMNGIYYLDNNTTRMDKSGSFAFHSATGEGMLYVDGDLTINAGFQYTGLIYVEGDLTMNGQAWILGALIVNGKTNLKQNGGSTLLYSSDAIKRVLAKYGGEFVTISWREAT